MKAIGVAFAIGGWLLAVAGLLISASTMIRGLLACVGIAITLYGVLGVLNGYHLERAIWKKK